MSSRYPFELSKSQQQLFQAWDKTYPPLAATGSASEMKELRKSKAMTTRSFHGTVKHIEGNVNPLIHRQITLIRHELKQIGCLSMKRKLLTLALASTLFGCGGGGDDTTQKNGNGSSGGDGGDVSYTYRAIDGYLGSAEVYADRNGNMKADGDEYIGLTGVDGDIQIKKSDSEFDIIIRVIAGQTTDSDIGSTVNYSKEMISDRGQRTITPFSTLAKLQGLTLAEMADILNLNYDDISGDYVANDAALAHAIARSLQLQLQAELVDNIDDIDGIQARASQITDYLKNVPEDNLTRIVIEIDSDGNLVESTTDKVHGKQFNIDNLAVAWEQKDFSTLNYDQGSSPQGFHPCYTQKWADVLLVANCQTSKLITLDIKTGSIVSESDMLYAPDTYEQLNWFLDGQYVGLVKSDKSIIYLDKGLQPASPNPSEMRYNSDSVISLGRRGALKAGDFYNYPGFSTWGNQEHLMGEISFYDGEAGKIVTIQADGTESETDTIKADTILQAIDAVSDNYEGGWVSKSDMTIRWISGSSFIVRLDTSGSNGYVSDDYHYLFNNGEIAYLGRFFQGTWRVGLDNTTVVHYSSYKGSDAPDHEMRQFDLNTGQKVGYWTATLDELPANLYGQAHYPDGIFANSDSYSTVILLK